MSRVRTALQASCRMLGIAPAPADPIADSIDRALAERKANRAIYRKAALKGLGK